MNPCVAPLPTLEPAHVEPQLPGNAPSKRCVNSLNLMPVQLPNASGAALSILNTAAKRWLFRIKVCVGLRVFDHARVAADAAARDRSAARGGEHGVLDVGSAVEAKPLASRLVLLCQ